MLSNDSAIPTHHEQLKFLKHIQQILQSGSLHPPLYPADTGHNFVLADETCKSQKSNFLASDKFLQQWLARNERYDQIITTEIS